MPQRASIPLLVLAALLLSVVATADEEWSWGTVDGKPSASQTARSQRSGRQNSGRLVFEDTDVRGRNPRVDLTSGFQSDESVNAFRVNAVPPRSSRIHSVQTVDNPRLRPQVVSSSSSSSFGSSIRTPSNYDSSGAIDIPVYVPNSPEVVNVPISVTVDTSRGDRKLNAGSSEGRFFDIDKKLCKMGIGWNCGKKNGGRGAGYVNLDHVPYLPQPVYPPQYSAGPSPLPYGGGIQSSDVYHVQPVALQPVGSPIQAIPLGPSGGQVPHGQGPPHGLSYGGGHIAHHPQQIPYQPPVKSIPYAAPHQQYPVPHLQPSYNPPHRESFKVVHDQPYKSDDGKVVQHIHQHTHIYNGGKPSDSQYTGSVHRPSREHPRVLPVIPPHPNTLHYTTGYRESCECVGRYKCATYDVIGRNPAPFNILDARTNNAGVVYSNFTSTEENITTTEAPHKRTKRDNKITKRQTNSFLKPEERRFTVGYTPGPDGCHRKDVCCRSPGRSDNVGIKTFSCGRRHSNGIVGRVKTPYHEAGDTMFGEYPWHAAILKRDGHEMVYVCGGSLIDDRHIVTAAHCVNKLKYLNLQVRLGEWDVANEDEFYENVNYSVDNLIIHPSFYAGMLHNDIALLKLDRYVDFHRYPHIAPICLPEPYSHFEGKTCHVTGWGKDAFGKVGSFQQVLKKIEVPMVRKSSCERALQDTRLGRGFRLHDGMSCAGGEEDKDACKGDGGGPLVCRGSAGEYQLAGVVSWGIGCGERGIPGVYVDVPHYVDWIHENTRF